MEGQEEHVPVPPLSNDAPGQPIPLAPPAGERKKRHRRTKAELEAERKRLAGEEAPTTGPNPEELKQAATALAMTFRAVGAVVSSKRGEHWQLKDKECETLGNVWATVLAPYLPRVAAASPLIFALASTWMIVQPRIEEDQRQEARRKMETGDQQ